MKRVLIVAYYYPPLADSGTQRPLKFTKYLREFGWEPTVLTVLDPPNPRRDETLLQEIPKGIQVVRTRMVNDALAHWLNLRGAGRLAESLRWRAREWFCVPDLYALWKRPAVQAGIAVHREAPFDAIYATGYPWTALLVGQEIAAATGVPFAADFRDPWTGDDTFRTERPIHAKEWGLEASVVREASVVVSVSEVMTNEMRRLHHRADPRKFHTVWNGFDPEDRSSLTPVPVREIAPFTIGFTGVFRQEYGPQLLYEAVALLRNEGAREASAIRLVTAGYAPGPAAQYGILESVQERGVVPHDEALGIMRSADALFVQLPGGCFARLALPGKLFEYLISGTPVIACAQPDSEVAGLLRKVGGGILIGRDVRQMASLMQTCVRTGRLLVPPLKPDELSNYSRRNLTGRLAAILDEIAASSSGGGLGGM